MTEYFDDVWRQLSRLDFEDSKIHDRLREIEFKLVSDVSICTQLPGFPEDLRAAIDIIITAGGVYTTPDVRGFPQGDTEDLQDHRRKLIDLSGDLHTIFHEVEERQLDRFTDSPTCPVRCLFADAEERRENNAAGFVFLMKLLPWLQESPTSEGETT